MSRFNPIQSKKKNSFLLKLHVRGEPRMTPSGTLTERFGSQQLKPPLNLIYDRGMISHHLTEIHRGWWRAASLHGCHYTEKWEAQHQADSAIHHHKLLQDLPQEPLEELSNPEQKLTAQFHSCMLCNVGRSFLKWNKNLHMSPQFKGNGRSMFRDLQLWAEERKHLQTIPGVAMPMISQDLGRRLLSTSTMSGFLRLTFPLEQMKGVINKIIKSQAKTSPQT